MEADAMDARLAGLLRRACVLAGPSFAGLGVVFYEELSELSYLPLHAPPADVYDAVGDAAVAAALARLSTSLSPWHDGFHFVSLGSMRLTHVSQFVSPPVAHGVDPPPTERGARHMAAALTSMVEGVVSVGVMPIQGAAVLYKDGERVRIKEAN